MATAKKAVEPAKKVVAAPAKVEKKVVKAAPMKAGCGRCAPKAAEKAAPVAKKTVAAAKPVAKKAAAPKAAKPVAKKPVAKKAAPKK